MPELIAALNGLKTAIDAKDKEHFRVTPLSPPNFVEADAGTHYAASRHSPLSSPARGGVGH